MQRRDWGVGGERGLTSVHRLFVQLGGKAEYTGTGTVGGGQLGVVRKDKVTGFFFFFLGVCFSFYFFSYLVSVGCPR